MLGGLLYLVSLLYGFVIRLRAAGYHMGLLKTRKLPCRVISVGNITVGGTGKTPLTLYVAELIHRLGYRPVIISRGYKGAAEKSGGIVSEGRKVLMTAETAGDEPYMMALRLKSIQVPVIVGKDRYSAGRLALNRFDPEVIVLDDAFQHAKLARDIDLVLLDYNKPLGNGHLLPRGVLREPAAVLSRADAVIVTRTDHIGGPPGTAAVPAQVQPVVQNKPVFRTAHVPYVSSIVKNSPGEDTDGASQTDANYLHGRNVFAFSGIARNEDFEQTLQQLGCVVVGFVGFSDHHRYTDEDIRLIMNAAADTGAVCLLTTEKDYVRIVNRLPLPLPLVVIGIRLQFLGDTTAFDGYIADRLAHCA